MVRCHSSSFYSVLKPIKMAKNVVIKELLDNPFSVLNKGGHTPPLPKLIIHQTKTTIYKTFLRISV